MCLLKGVVQCAYCCAYLPYLESQIDFVIPGNGVIKFRYTQKILPFLKERSQTLAINQHHSNVDHCSVLIGQCVKAQFSLLNTYFKFDFIKLFFFKIGKQDLLDGEPLKEAVPTLFSYYLLRGTTVNLSQARPNILPQIFLTSCFL